MTWDDFERAVCAVVLGATWKGCVDDFACCSSADTLLTAWNSVAKQYLLRWPQPKA